MEKKSIGSFIATLRKANGMTQKELADMLNVSDKTISRWERDDGLPELSAIPVIAEIFGVSCDELLNGARKPIGERSGQSKTEELTQKSEKQRKRLLAAGLSNYKTQCYIAIGCSFVGLIATMICNLGFLRAYIGFFVGTIFYLISVVFQTIVINRAFLSVSDESLDLKETGSFRWKVVKFAEWSYGLTAVLFAFTLPLILIPGTSTVGLTMDYWFVYGILAAIIGLLIFVIVCHNLNDSLVKKEMYRLPEKEEQIFYHNHKLNCKSVTITVVVLAITLLFHALGGELLWSTSMLSEGTTFHDYDSFIKYMEMDVPYEPGRSNGLFITSEQSLAAPHNSATEIAAPSKESDIIWYDEHGNEVSEEEARKRTLEDINGEVVCTYICRNESVTRVSYSPKEGTVLPITVYTYEEQRVARNISELITSAYCLLYPIEIVVAFILYYRKRANDYNCLCNKVLDWKEKRSKE